MMFFAPTRRRVRNGIVQLTLFLSLLGSTFCTYGELADGEQEQEALASFLLGSARADLNLNLRFTDGGSDSIASFNTSAGNMVLSGLKIEIDEVELIYEQGFFQGILTHLLYIHRSGDLYAHGEEVVNTGDPVFLIPGQTFTLTGADGTDPGGRAYQNLLLSRQVPPGRIKSIKLHLKSVTATGTDDGTPFASIVQQQSDITVSLQCVETLSTGNSQLKYIRIDFNTLFATGSSESHIASAMTNGALAREAECFTF